MDGLAALGRARGNGLHFTKWVEHEGKAEIVLARGDWIGGGRWRRFDGDGGYGDVA